MTSFNIYNQYNFNKNTLRPWLVPEMSNNLKIEKTHMEFMTAISNRGYSPAIDAYLFNDLNKSKQFPKDTFKNQLRKRGKYNKSIIFPNQKKVEAIDSLKFTSPGVDLPKDIVISKIRDFLLKDEVYLHLYLEYMSSDKHKLPKYQLLSLYFISQKEAV